ARLRRGRPPRPGTPRPWFSRRALFRNPRKGSAGVELDDQLLVADDRNLAAVRVAVEAEGEAREVDLEVAGGLALPGPAALARDDEGRLLAGPLADLDDVLGA